MPGRSRWFAVGAMLALVAASLPAAIPTASAAEPRARVDSELYAALADGGTTEFLVYLAEAADLSSAATYHTKLAKTEHVYQQLTAVAEASQAGLRADLDRRGIAYEPFWITNALLVAGDRELLDELAARADVASIEPDRSYPLIAPTAWVAPASAIQAIEWGVTDIKADQVWSEFGATGEGIVVANIDTGVQFDHPALVEQYRGTATGSHSYNWFDPMQVCPDPATPCDNNGHGTHTMGTMVGDDGAGNQIGVAPGAQWIAAKGCETDGCSGSALIAAGQWILAPTDSNGANPDPAMAPDIVNNSWGGGHGDTWYQAIVDAWVNAGIFPMFAAGNTGPDCDTVTSPGDNSPAYAVGAHSMDHNIAAFSSRGPSGVDGDVKPDITAPGVGIRSAVPTNGYALLSGTSMATPHASGAVALLWSAVPELRGDIDATRAVLDQSAVDVEDDECGASTTINNNTFGEGRLDVFAAVSQARGSQ
ncbi:MAG TPA: S8 family serine peptidase [Natronosporangium sp.]